MVHFEVLSDVDTNITLFNNKAMKKLILAVLTIITVQASFAAQKLTLPNLFTTQSFKVQGSIFLPKGQKLNKGAPSNITVLEKIEGEWKEISKLKLAEIFTISENFPYSFSVLTQRKDSAIKIKASLYHCDKVKNNYCVIDDFEGEFNRNPKSNKMNLSLDLKGSSSK